MRVSAQDWSTLSREQRQWIPARSGIPQKGFPCKRFGIDAAGQGENAFVFQVTGSFPLLSVKIRETEELENHEENFTKSSMDRRDLVAAAHSLYPQTDLIQRNLSTAKLFSCQHPAPFPLCAITWLQSYADKMSGLHLSPSLLPAEVPASAFLMKDYLCTQICAPCALHTYKYNHTQSLLRN